MPEMGRQQTIFVSRAERETYRLRRQINTMIVGTLKRLLEKIILRRGWWFDLFCPNKQQNSLQSDSAKDRTKLPIVKMSST